MYTHRAGRTARMGNEGEVISLVSEKDYLLFGKIKKTENIEEMKKPNFRRLFFKMEKGGMKHNGCRKKTKYHGRGKRY
jgi:superfamily II DNA/RNA helicase